MPKRRRIGVSVSELRRHFGKYLLLSRKVDLIVYRRGKPVAVMVGIERFQRLVTAANGGGRKAALQWQTSHPLNAEGKPDGKGVSPSV